MCVCGDISGWAYLYSQTGLHEVELVHQLLMQRPHILRDVLLVHGQTVLQDVRLQVNAETLSVNIKRADRCVYHAASF